MADVPHITRTNKSRKGLYIVRICQGCLPPVNGLAACNITSEDTVKGILALFLVYLGQNQSEMERKN